MNESGYYPAGAEHDSRAPWNEVDIPKKEFDVFISQTLSKTTNVTTNDYKVDFAYDGEPDDAYADVDTSETNWKEAYNDNNHYTPLELINILKKYLEEAIVNQSDKTVIRRMRNIIAECDNWTEDDLLVTED